MAPYASIEIIKCSSNSPDATLADSDTRSHATFTGEIEVQPKKQPRIKLGYFLLDQMPKKILLAISPAVEIDAITAYVTGMKDADDYELFINVANYGDAVVSAKIWSLS